MSDPMAPLDPILRELGREHRAQLAPASLERALAAEFRRRHRKPAWRWFAAATAAAAAGAFAFFLLQPPEAETLALRVAPPRAPEVRATPKPAPPKVEAAARTRRAAAVRTASIPAPKPEPEPLEIATDFFPLRPGPVLEPGELAQVIRARIPRRELLRFGLTAAEFYPNRAAGEDVRADVVFGHDGTARAIRFVRDYQ